MNGYAGRILRVDLTVRSVRPEELSAELARGYLGGRGFAAKLLWDESPTGGSPLAPEAPVIVASGPLSGLFMPGSGKVTFAAKSPATGGYGDSNMGGHLAAELKFAGYDALVITGRSEQPVVLVIDGGKVSFRDGSPYWGKGALETEAMLKSNLGEDFQIATIGPAGERLVAFACVSHDFGRQAGRTGIGAVLGSKRVKAIAVRGHGTIPVAKPAAFRDKGKEMFKACFAKPGFKEWTPYGTAGVTDWVNEVGAFPTRNFQTAYFDGHRDINGQTLKERILVTDKGCFACPTPCGKYSRLERIPGRAETFVEGPEYETIALLGGNCLLGTIEEVAYANYVCDELGLDTISGGNVVAFALECFEQGLISADDVGRKVRFGDLDSVVHLLKLIAARRGIGDVLARGVKGAAEAIGGGSEEFAIHVKGLEWSGYEARYAPAMMLSYMTADVGAHHNRSWAITHDVATGRGSVEGKARRVIELQHIRPLFDALGVCRLQWVEIGFELEHYAELFPLVTGWDYTWPDLLRLSERIWNLTRCFWLREVPGFGRSMDYPPGRLYKEPVPSGPSQGHVIDRPRLDALLDEYYALRGWDANGRPTAARLRELGLDFVLPGLKGKVS
ncbi:MAG: aldehyde ferredoxin oxidoreductase family protein [Bacillota bacterium]